MRATGASITSFTPTAAVSGKSVLGAVGYRFHAVDHPDTMAAVQLLARAIGREPGPYAGVFVQDFNDTHGHAEAARR